MRKPVPFGKYCLLERVSVGGMAEVFKAKQFGAEGFAKTIAIKRILPNMAEDAEFITMFIDEAKIAVQLNHANVCQIYELGKIFSSHYIVMEYIPGKDLLQINNHFKRNRRRMPLDMACYIVSKVCEGLDYAHRKRDPNMQELGLVHRDISPQNVLVSYGGECKIIDFGIAKASTRSTKTQVGVLKGKFGYMSPEQVRGLPLDRRSDIFAAGTVLYEILTAKRLFVADTDFATLEKVRKVDIDAPSVVRPDIPDELERILLRALSREREERYQWASELQEDLQRFLVRSSRPFTAHQMSEWMRGTFTDEVVKEKERDEYYATIRSPEDLRQGDDEPAPPANPLDQPIVDEKGDATVIFAQASASHQPATPGAGAPPPIPAAAVGVSGDEPFSTQELVDLGLSARSFVAPPDLFAGAGEPSGDGGDEATAAVAGISDEQFESIMAKSAATRDEPKTNTDPEEPAPTPLAIPRPANRFQAPTLALSGDEIEMVAGSDDSGAPPVGAAGAPPGPVADAPAGERAAMPKIPVRVKNPEPRPPDPPTVPVSPPPPAARRGALDAMGAAMMAPSVPPPAIRPPAAAPPPAAPPPPAPLSPPRPPPPPLRPPPAVAPPRPWAPPPLATTPMDMPSAFAEKVTGPAATSAGRAGRLLREIAIGAFVAGVILAGGVSAWWFFSGSGSATPEVAQPPTGQVRLDLTPAGLGATVTVAGASARYEPDGPTAWLSLAAGQPHPITVARPGFVTQRVTVTLEPGERRSLPVTLKELRGAIRLTSTPPGAKVSLDGRKVGRTPWQETGLPADRSYELMLSKKGYEDWADNVRFTPDSPEYVRKVDLAKGGGGGAAADDADHGGGAAAAKASPGGVGFLTVSAGADVWAKVGVDGTDTGRTTPIHDYNKLPLSPGEHTISLEAGGKTVEERVTITAGETTKLRTKL